MNSNQSEGGKARARSLTKDERSKIAQRAAEERWNSTLPLATHEGVLHIAGLELSVVVLPSGQRIVSQAGFLRAIGRSRSLRGGTGVTSSVDSVPFFLQNKVFQGYSSEIESMPAKPVFYRDMHNKKGVGYDALLLPRVAELYLMLRDDLMKDRGSIPRTLTPYIAASDILIRGLADVGMIALVDEATGYQNDRAKDALAKILNEFIAKEIRPWVKTFPDEFYENMFRLQGLNFPRDIQKRPKYFGIFTNDIIYERLAPAVLEELKKLTPKTETGRLKQHLHRRLSDGIGHPKLREHLASVITLMKISKDYKSFHKLLDQVHPKFGDNLQLPLGDQTENNSLLK